MSDVIAVQVDPQLNIEKEKLEKTLEQQRLDLCFRLHENRRILETKLLGTREAPSTSLFPRSATLRFLSRPDTHHIVKTAANAALGLQTFRSLHYGYSLVKLFRKVFKRHKN